MTTSEYAYENTRRIVYGDEGAQFVPVCPYCGRFVKADDAITVNGDGEWIGAKQPHHPKARNATCAKCGRVMMPFEGYAE